MPGTTATAPREAPTPIRTVWFGMRCEFTRAALAGALAAGGVAPVAVVLPRGPRPLGAGWPAPPLDGWLRERGIAVLEVDGLRGAGRAAVLELIAAERVALGVGACLPWKVPRAVREALAGGVLNIHPSLLPALRGPEPVFHAYRLGLAETGVSVHLMDAGWDSGPLLAQERVPVPDHQRAEAFEAALAERGGRLLAAVAPRWLAGDLAGEPQDEGATSWAPLPDAAARTIPPGLTVAQATRFLTACGPLRARDADTGAWVTVTAAAPGDAALRPGRSAVRVSLRDGELWARREARPAGPFRTFDRSS